MNVGLTFQQVVVHVCTMLNVADDHALTYALGPEWVYLSH